MPLKGKADIDSAAKKRDNIGTALILVLQGDIFFTFA